MDQKNFATVYIVRHGETEWNVRGVLQGHADSPLTEKGIAQAHELREKLKDVGFDLVFSSDLLRAKRTAEIIALDRELILNTSELLRERQFGVWEGKLYELFQNERKLIEEKMALSTAERRRHKIHDSMESDDEITDRLILFLREIGTAYPGKTVLAASHGGIMRAFLARLGWANDDELRSGAVKNTAYIKVATDGVEIILQEVTGVEKRVAIPK